MKETAQPKPADIEVQVRPFDQGLILGRHPDGGTTIRLTGEFVLRVNPPGEPATTPREEWAFPTVALTQVEPKPDPFVEEAAETTRPPQPVRFRMQLAGREGGVHQFRCVVPGQEEGSDDGAFFFALDEQTGAGTISMADPLAAPALLAAFARALVDPARGADDDG